MKIKFNATCNDSNLNIEDEIIEIPDWKYDHDIKSIIEQEFLYNCGFRCDFEKLN